MGWLGRLGGGFSNVAGDIYAGQQQNAQLGLAKQQMQLEQARQNLANLQFQQEQNAYNERNAAFKDPAGTWTRITGLPASGPDYQEWSGALPWINVGVNPPTPKNLNPEIEREVFEEVKMDPTFTGIQGDLAALRKNIQDAQGVLQGTKKPADSSIYNQLNGTAAEKMAALRKALDPNNADPATSYLIQERQMEEAQRQAENDARQRVLARYPGYAPSGSGGGPSGAQAPSGAMSAYGIPAAEMPPSRLGAASSTGGPSTPSGAAPPPPPRPGATIVPANQQQAAPSGGAGPRRLAPPLLTLPVPAGAAEPSAPAAQAAPAPSTSRIPGVPAEPDTSPETSQAPPAQWPAESPAEPPPQGPGRLVRVATKNGWKWVLFGPQTSPPAEANPNQTRRVATKQGWRDVPVTPGTPPAETPAPAPAGPVYGPPVSRGFPLETPRPGTRTARQAPAPPQIPFSPYFELRPPAQNAPTPSPTMGLPSTPGNRYATPEAPQTPYAPSFELRPPSATPAPPGAGPMPQTAGPGTPYPGTPQAPDISPGGELQPPAATGAQTPPQPSEPSRQAAGPRQPSGGYGYGGRRPDPPGRMPLAQRESTVRTAARANGIDPEVAVQIARNEGLMDNNFQGDFEDPISGKASRNGVPRSGGAFQLYTGRYGGGGLGSEYQRQTGHSPLDPRYEDEAIWWTMNYVRTHGWKTPAGKYWFHGAQKARDSNGQPIDRWTGIERGQRAVGPPAPEGIYQAQYPD